MNTTHVGHAHLPHKTLAIWPRKVPGLRQHNDKLATRMKFQVRNDIAILLATSTAKENVLPKTLSVHESLEPLFQRCKSSYYRHQSIFFY